MDDKILEICPCTAFIVKYASDGLCVPDLQVKKEALNIANKKHSVTVSQEVLIDALRILVKTGVLSSNEILFEYNGTLISVDRYGKLDEWPAGFCDLKEKLLAELL